jgi:hypothetical protein
MLGTMPAEPIGEIDSRFSSEGVVAPTWADVVDILDKAEMSWLSTTRPDGRPHVTPLPAVWDSVGGMLHFCTGPGEQKAKNLDHEPRCVLTTGTNFFRSGTDVIVEGRARRVTDETTLRRLADRWLEKLGWPFEVVEGGFRDPGAADGDKGAAMAYVYSLFTTKVLVFGKGEPYSQARFRF